MIQSVLFIGCMPLEFMEQPPTDWQDGRIARCISCDEEVWLSKRKQELKTKNPEAKMMCLPCVARAHTLLKQRGKTVEIIDIANQQ